MGQKPSIAHRFVSHCIAKLDEKAPGDGNTAWRRGRANASDPKSKATTES